MIDNTLSLFLENSSNKVKTSTTKPPKQGVYMGVTYTPESDRMLNSIAKDLGITPDNGEGKELDFHTTIMYSRHPKGVPTEVNDIRTVQGTMECKLKIPVTIRRFGFFDTPDGRNFHVRVEAPFLDAEWQRTLDQGAKYDYDDYIPHITIANDVPKDFTIPKDIKDKYYSETLWLDRQYVEDLMDIQPVNDTKQDKDN